MKSYRLRAHIQMALMLVGCALFLVLGACRAAHGQINAGDRNSAPRTLPPESASKPLPGTRGAIIVGSDGESEDPTERQRTRAVMAQISEDFLKIQLVHNEMMKLSTSGKPLDYKYISEVTAEIRKRANRLKNNLKLPAPDSSEKGRKYRAVTDEAELKKALRELDDLMMSFVNNPLFQQAQIVDLQLANKAQSDLRAIIESSQGISRDADRLGKTTKTQ